jgi:DNA-binding Xre family transcriptional regulator
MENNNLIDNIGDLEKFSNDLSQRMKTYLIAHPTSLKKLADDIGVQFSTLRDFFMQTRKVNFLTLHRMDTFLKNKQAEADEIDRYRAMDNQEASNDVKSFSDALAKKMKLYLQERPTELKKLAKEIGIEAIELVDFFMPERKVTLLVLHKINTFLQAKAHHGK